MTNHKGALASENSNEGTKSSKGKTVNPIVILMGILFLAMLLTYVIDSGSFERNGRLVVPGSYSGLEKDASIMGVLGLPQVAQEGEAHPVGVVGTLLTIPKGLEKGAGLIFMVLIIGGMFGILTQTGVVPNVSFFGR